MRDLAEYVGIGLLCTIGIVLLTILSPLIVFVIGWVTEWLFRCLGHDMQEWYWTAVGVCAVLSFVVVPAISKCSKD